MPLNFCRLEIIHYLYGGGNAGNVNNGNMKNIAFAFVSRSVPCAFIYKCVNTPLTPYMI